MTCIIYIITTNPSYDQVLQATAANKMISIIATYTSHVVAEKNKRVGASAEDRNSQTIGAYQNGDLPIIIVSFFERLWRRDFETHMFTEQYRLAARLEEVFNYLFYDGKITNAECTKIENRPGAQRAIQYTQSTYPLYDSIPHVCLNVTDGVCLRGVLKSRFNLHNIAVTTHTVMSMIAEGLWTEEETSIITPYRKQTAQYRRVFRSQILFRLQVFTADSVQGRENKCTIFDIDTINLSYDQVLHATGLNKMISIIAAYISRIVTRRKIVLEPAQKRELNKHTVRFITVIFPGRWNSIDLQMTDAFFEE